MIKIVKEHIRFHNLSTKNTAAYFDSFGIEYIPQEVLKKTKINQLLTIYLKYKIMNLLCVGIYCIGFIEYVLAGKTLLDYTNLFSLNDYRKNYNITHVF